MTNLKPVTEGFNKFCGPAVLSILTGKSTDECADVIRYFNKEYNVAGVQLSDLLLAADKMGFASITITPSGSLFRSLITLVTRNGMYIVTVKNHFVCIEVKDRQIFFCDNHTKEPIPAGSSARLGQEVLAINLVIERPKPIEKPKPKEVSRSIDTFITKSHINGLNVEVRRTIEFDDGTSKIEYISGFDLASEAELKATVHSLISRMNVIRNEGLDK